MNISLKYGIGKKNYIHVYIKHETKYKYEFVEDQRFGRFVG